MCRIMTSNYKNCITENGISISSDKGKLANFKGESLTEFSPEKSFWKKWNENKDRIPEQDIWKYFTNEYYKKVLSKLDPEEMLNKIPDGSILLCYGDNEDPCHRHLVAFWYELFLGIPTSEVIENPKRETVRRVERPDYLKEMLEDAIKENYDMNGFNDIKDAYEYNKEKKKKLKMVL